MAGRDGFRPLNVDAVECLRSQRADFHGAGLDVRGQTKHNRSRTMAPNPSFEPRPAADPPIPPAAGPLSMSRPAYPVTRGAAGRDASRPSLRATYPLCSLTRQLTQTGGASRRLSTARPEAGQRAASRFTRPQSCRRTHRRPLVHSSLTGHSEVFRSHGPSLVFLRRVVPCSAGESKGYRVRSVPMTSLRGRCS